MAARNVNGKDVLLFKGNDPDNPSTYIPVGCLTNLTVGRSRATNSTETKCGTLNSEGSTTYTSTFDSIVIWGDNSTAKTQHRDLVDYFNTEGRQAWKIAPELPLPDDNVITFTGTISALNDTYGATGFATTSGTFNPENNTWKEVGADEFIMLSNSGDEISPGNVAKGSQDNIIFITEFEANTPQNPSTAQVTLTGTFDAGDIASVTLWKSTKPDFSEAVIESTVSALTLASGATVTFNNVSSTIVGLTYFWVTATIGTTTADTGHTIICSKITFNTLTVTATDTQTTPGGAKTIS